MQQILIVGAGGCVGAICRYALTGAMHRRLPGFTPAGTMLVNVLGCLVIGMLMTLAVQRSEFSPQLRLFLVTGLLGSLTTFSTFGYETVTLLHEQRPGLALVNIVGNLCIGLAAVWFGQWLITAVSRT